MVQKYSTTMIFKKTKRVLEHSHTLTSISRQSEHHHHWLHILQTTLHDVASNILKGKWYTLKGGNSFKMGLPLFWNGVYSKRKEFAPLGSKFFPFRVDPFSEENLCSGKPTGSHKSYLPCKVCQKKSVSESSSLKDLMVCIWPCSLEYRNMIFQNTNNLQNKKSMKKVENLTNNNLKA